MWKPLTWNTTIVQSSDNTEYKGEDLGSTLEGTQIMSQMGQVIFFMEYKLPKQDIDMNH